jgi:Mn2+/Fe2+ NRAMP family transporter
MAETTELRYTIRLYTRAARFLAVFGPGIVVMLADTDVGSIITAGQSGVQWGYRLLPLQFALIPILFMAQELTVRLGIHTGRGHGALICATFGRAWGWVSVAGLAAATLGALLSEFSGIAAVGDLYGVSRWISLPSAAATLMAVMLIGSRRRIEFVAMLLGLFAFAFFLVAWRAHPAPREILAQSVQIPFTDARYLYLVAANMGTVIMPWMIFYQQAAVAGKGLRPDQISAARTDTAIGAVVTQLVMAAVLVACAATIGKANPQASLATIGDMAAALTPLLGATFGRLVFGIGVLGAGMVAAIVASLALAWGVGEVAGFGRAPAPGRRFNTLYALCIAGGAGLVAVSPNLVALTLAVQVMNALLLPLVLGLLIALSIRALPPGVRLHGAYLWAMIAMTAAMTMLGVLGLGL